MEGDKKRRGGEETTDVPLGNGGGTEVRDLRGLLLLLLLLLFRGLCSGLSPWRFLCHAFLRRRDLLSPLFVAPFLFSSSSEDEKLRTKSHLTTKARKRGKRARPLSSSQLGAKKSLGMVGEEEDLHATCTVQGRKSNHLVPRIAREETRMHR